jgi:hypothetical protein
MTEQIQLFADEPARDWKAIIRRHWPTVLESIRHAADRIGRKQVAADLDIKVKVLDNVLADRERHHLKARYLVYFVMNDRVVAETICTLRGGRYAESKPKTPAEKLEALEAEVRALGPVGQVLLERAEVR